VKDNESSCCYDKQSIAGIAVNFEGSKADAASVAGAEERGLLSIGRPLASKTKERSSHRRISSFSSIPLLPLPSFLTLTIRNAHKLKRKFNGRTPTSSSTKTGKSASTVAGSRRRRRTHSKREVVESRGGVFFDFVFDSCHLRRAGRRAASRSSPSDDDDDVFLF